MLGFLGMKGDREEMREEGNLVYGMLRIKYISSVMFGSEGDASM